MGSALLPGDGKMLTGKLLVENPSRVEPAVLSACNAGRMSSPDAAAAGRTATVIQRLVRNATGALASALGCW